ncbi:hypothetical protein Ancab_038499 [Ancistrocladus abbreviatus]
MMSLTPWFHKKIVDPLQQILRRGTEPKQLAFSAALGFTLGIFPICGVTVFLCGMAIALLGSRCHSPTVMLANFVATPIELRWSERELCNQFTSFDLLPPSAKLPRELEGCFSSLYILVVPFLRFGEAISGGPHFPLTSDALKKVLTGQASSEVLRSIAHALLGWLFAAPFILAILYILFIPCFKFLVRKFSAVPVSPRKPLYNHQELKLKARGV